MKSWFQRVAWGFSSLCLVAVAGVVPADAQSFDHMTCIRVNKDLRNALMPPPLTLDAEQIEFLDSQGCKPVGGGRIARAQRLCFPTSKAPSNPPGGISLSGQDFLCYRVKCQSNGGSMTELTLTDQFGTGTVRANEKPVVKELCVPAFKPGGPSPTPTPAVTATPTPSPTGVVPTATPSATPTATPPYGSASEAFVDQVPSLLH